MNSLENCIDIVINNIKNDAVGRQRINIQLRGHIVYVLGKSGIGKTFMFGAVKELQQDLLNNKSTSNIDISNIDIITEESEYKLFCNSVETGNTNGIKPIVIIDECDVLGVMSNNGIAQFIRNDLSRHYLLMMRSSNTHIKYGDCLGTTPANIAELTYSDEEFRLSYKYDIGGR